MKTKLLIFLSIWCLAFRAQTTSTITTSIPLTQGNGKDTYLASGEPAVNYGSHPSLGGNTWTCLGNLCLSRALFQFDMSSVPANAVITNASLLLYADYTWGTDPTTGGPNNTGYLSRVTSAWGENTVTWNSQPATSTLNVLSIPGSNSGTQNYTLNVTSLVQDMQTYGNNGFMLRMQDEVNYYKSLMFASSDNGNAPSPYLNITYIVPTNTFCALQASFNQSTFSVTARSFTSTTTGTNNNTTYSWNFGDGATATGITAFHNYAPGSYIVSLTASNNSTPACVSTATQAVIVSGTTLTPCSVNASYNYYQYAPGQISFTSTSTGTLSNSVYTWNFGDGTYGGGYMVNHTYTVNGTYYTSLVITNTTIPNCVSTSTQAIVITSATACHLQAGFTSHTFSSSASFTNTSTGTNFNTTYSWNFGDGTTGTGLTPSHTYSASGIYSVVLVANNNYSPSCVSTSTQVVVIGCALNASYSYNQFTPGTVSFTNTSTGTQPNVAYVYSWNFGDGSGSTFTSPLHTYTANGTYYATLTITNSLVPNCTDSVMHSIVVSSVTPCNLQASFTQITYSPTIKGFISTSTGTVSNSVYTWNFGDGSTGNGASVIHNYAANGSYNVVLVVSNTFVPGCTSTYTQNVVINNTITPCGLVSSFVQSTLSINTLSFTSTSTGTLANTIYSWNFGDGSTALGASVLHTYSGNGNFNVSLVVTNSTVPNCSSTSTHVVIITNNTVTPCNLQASFTQTTFSVTSKGFTSTSVGTTSTTTYLWNFGDGSTATGMTAFHTYTANGTYNVVLFVNNNTTPVCAASYTQSIVINNTITPCSLVSGFVQSTLSINTLSFTSTSTGTLANTIYSWNFGDGSTALGASVLHTYSGNGSFNVSLVVTNSTVPNCSSTSTHVVIITNNTVTPCNLQASFTQTTFSVASRGFTSTSVGTTSTTTYLWNFGDGSSATGMTAFHTYTANGTYNVVLFVNNNTTPVCAASYTQSVVVSNPSCNLVAGFVQYTVSAGVIGFSNTSTGTVPNTSYTWNFGDGTTGTGASITHAYANSGTYNVALVVNNLIPACISTATHVVVVVASTVTPCNLQASFTQTTYSPTIKGFTSTSTGTVSNTVYNWNFGDGSTGSGVSVIHTYTVNGSYNVVLVVTNTFVAGCTSTYTQNVVINNTITPACNLVASFIQSTVSASTRGFTSTTTGGATNYSWNFGDGSTGSGSPVVHTYTANGSYNVTLVATNSLVPNCSATATHVAIITNNTITPCNLVASFTQTTYSPTIRGFNSTSTGTTSGTSYSWNFGDGSTGSGSPIVHTYTANGTYNVVLVASNNTTPSCVSTSTQVVTISNTTVTPCNVVASFIQSTVSASVRSFTSTTTGGANNYSWNFGDGSTGSGLIIAHTYTANGSYNVTLVATNSLIPNCSATATHVVVINTSTVNPCPLITNFTYTIGANGFVNFFNISTGTTGSTTYTWTFGDGTSANTPGATHTYSASGSYVVHLYASNNSTFAPCSGSAVQVVNINLTSVGIAKQSAQSLISVFPNPSNGILQIELPAVTEKTEFILYSVLGQEIMRSDLPSNSTTIHLEDLASGAYYYHVRQSDNILKTGQIIFAK